LLYIQKFYVHRGRDLSDWDVHLQKELGQVKKAHKAHRQKIIKTWLDRNSRLFGHAWPLVARSVMHYSHRCWKSFSFHLI